MKKILILSVLVLFAFVSNAQKYPFGKADTETLTSASTIALSNISDNLTIFTLATDTTLTINAATLDDGLNTGAEIVFVLTESTANADTVSWGTNLTGLADPLPSGKTRIVKFIYNGTGFYKVASTQVD